MVIDICFLVLAVTAIYKGYNRGLIVAIFSFVAIVVGLAAALKLSAITANWLSSNTSISGSWLPFISFTITFILFVVGIRLVANILQKTVEFALMGWVNKLGGIALYVLMYTLVFSVVLFFVQSIHVLKPSMVQQSVTYTYLQPFGPWVVNGIGKVIPIFSNLFLQLQHFFDAVKTNIA
jgi:membrane protein required for colicin V production